MNNWFYLYFAAFGGGCALCLVFTPLCRKLAARLGFMDVPANNHKGHRKATPLLGGLAMYCAWAAGIAGGGLLLPVLARKWGGELAKINFSGGAAAELAFLCLAATGAIVLGLIDDKYALSAGVKFGGQFIVALIAVLWGGVRITLFINFPAITIGISVFWVMLMMNSINFFDNMDGLAAGTIAIATGFFAVIAALNCQYLVALFSALCCGVCCGFWFFNAAPATIFMGDSGSHFVGFLAAVIAARVTCFDISSSLSRFPVLIPALILALPLFDTLMVVLIRTWNRKPFWIGDHNHISHRFCRMGLSRPQAVMLVHLIAFVIALTTLPIYWGDFKTALVLVLQTVFILAVVTILQTTVRNSSGQ